MPSAKRHVKAGRRCLGGDGEVGKKGSCWVSEQDGVKRLQCCVVQREGMLSGAFEKEKIS